MNKLLRTLVLSILAGIAIGLGSFLFILINTTIKDGSASMLASMMFSVGLILVCVFGLNLYTGKIGLIFDDKRQIKDRVTDLPIILFGNAIGAFGLGILFHFIFISWEDFASMSQVISTMKTVYEPLEVLANSVFCGALVFIAVYIYKNIENWAMKIIGIVVSVTLFVYCGFQHCIANMFYFGAAFNWNTDMIINLVMVILGNSLGAFAIRLFVYVADVAKLNDRR